MASRTNSINEKYAADEIADRFLACEGWLRFVGQLVADVRLEIRRREVSVSDDRLFTQSIAQAPEPAALFDPAISTDLVTAICDVLEAGAGLTIQHLNALFDDAAQREAFNDALSSAWAQRPKPLPNEKISLEYGSFLDVYLMNAGFESGEPTVLPQGLVGWQAALKCDAPLNLIQHPDVVGLSSEADPAQPRLCSLHGLRGDISDADNPVAPPLDRTIYQRLWSVLKGTGGQPWRTMLPDLSTMVNLEIEASAQPLGFRTTEARCGLAAGVRAYVSITPDGTGHVDIPGAVGYLNTKINGFLAGVGGFAKLTYADQDRLSNPAQSLIPALWLTLHNAEFRPATTTDPIWVWSRIAGGIHTLIKEIQERHVKRGSAVTTDQVNSIRSRPVARLEMFDAEHRERDVRVEKTMAHVSDSLGIAVLKEMISRRDAADRETWEKASEEVTDTTSGSGASWFDLLGYLDDHLPDHGRSV